MFCNFLDRSALCLLWTVLQNKGSPCTDAHVPVSSLHIADVILSFDLMSTVVVVGVVVLLRVLSQLVKQSRLSSRLRNNE